MDALLSFLLAFEIVAAVVLVPIVRAELRRRKR